MPLRAVRQRSAGRAVIVGGAAVTETLAEPAQKWICQLCGLIYDPEEGDPDSGIAPGTPFEDIPEDWSCPICGAEKADFRPMEPDEIL